MIPRFIYRDVHSSVTYHREKCQRVKNGLSKWWCTGQNTVWPLKCFYRRIFNGGKMVIVYEVEIVDFKVVFIVWCQFFKIRCYDGSG